MFRAGFPPIIRSSKTVHTASGICQAWLLLAVAASKLDIYPMLCVQFLSSWWWAENPPETCRALTIIKNIVYSCILLVTLKRRYGHSTKHNLSVWCGFDSASSLICGDKMLWSWGLCVRFADQQLENHSTKYHRQQPLYNSLELLMMGTVAPETY